MTTPQPQSRWKLFAIAIIAALTATFLFATIYPWVAVLTGISMLACGVAFAAWPPFSQTLAQWRQISLPTVKTRIYLGAPIACYGVILLAISQSQIRANWRHADTRAAIARELGNANSAIEQKHAEEALKICAALESKANTDEKAKISAIRIRAQDIEKARQVRSANDKVLRLVSDGQTFIIKRELDNAQSSLDSALHVPLATEFSTANEFADQIASARTKLAAVHFEKGELSAAKEELKRAISVPTAKATAQAQRLLIDVCNREVVELVAAARQALNDMKRDDAANSLTRALAITEATENKEAQEMLSAINESRASEANERVSQLTADAQKSFDTKRYDEAIRTLNNALAVPHSTQKPQVTAQIQRIQKEQTAERDRQLALAKAEESRMAAAAEQERKTRAAAEAARKAEEEYEQNGLVLMRKTLDGKAKQFGAEITGTIINRRNRKLNYAQITFSLYDKSGAQVGTALANINGLEAGGTWKFKAVTLDDDWSTYKINELSGF